MRKYVLFCLLSVHHLLTSAQSPQDAAPQNWTNYIRTAGHGLNKNNIDATIQDAENTHLFGIEVDNDIPGRYNSFLDPREKLADIKALADRAHAIQNHAFVYIAGLECITANADQTPHSFFKDHPDWVQRDIHNRPAMFGGGEAFWITKGDEDVWISPYAPAWRTRYMEHIRQIAATGIDGIYVDIPYWMTHFKGWEDTWASFDDYTVAAFKEKTGLDGRKDLKLGDVHDANFRKWIDFRIVTLTDFMAEISKNAKSVNPDCKVIAEIYPGIGEEAVRVGADVYALYDAVDLIAHEFSGGEGNAAAKNPQQWFERMIGMYSFRSFAGGKASLMLSYSWMKENKVKPAEPMKNLALSNLMAGTNHYDARGLVMSGSNDIGVRAMMYKWIAANENTFYKPRKPIAPVGIYFSPDTRNYYPDSFVDSYQGIMEMLLQAHLEFEILTPRTLKNFHGQALILPDVKCLSAGEQTMLQQLVEGGMGLLVTGETGRYDEHGSERAMNPIREWLKVPAPDKPFASSRGRGKFMYEPECPGKQYSHHVKQEFDTAAWTGAYRNKPFFSFLQQFKTNITSYFALDTTISIEASPFVSAQVASVEGRPHVFLANFAGLKSDAVDRQLPAKGVTVRFKGNTGAKVYYLPFLGERQVLKPRYQSGRVICVLPAMEKGGVVWME